ncbi:uncharacterized protein NEMAJ01_1626 [Nematocida major]|uniref:uncharacterized protein n=1 Tax=Nematocida major TaxID=1912982 RepID=UPI0020084D01|nr:uncharacterized protein NEMAJ01_1626 [Nematocida major]KAH9386730.1 hypothetical protein NEMAJ01_1626 [Nematocida major]
MKKPLESIEAEVCKNISESIEVLPQSELTPGQKMLFHFSNPQTNKIGKGQGPWKTKAQNAFQASAGKEQEAERGKGPDTSAIFASLSDNSQSMGTAESGARADKTAVDATFDAEKADQGRPQAEDAQESRQSQKAPEELASDAKEKACGGEDLGEALKEGIRPEGSTEKEQGSDVFVEEQKYQKEMKALFSGFVLAVEKKVKEEIKREEATRSGGVKITQEEAEQMQCRIEALEKSLQEARHAMEKAARITQEKESRYIQRTMKTETLIKEKDRAIGQLKKEAEQKGEEIAMLTQAAKAMHARPGEAVQMEDEHQRKFKELRATISALQEEIKQIGLTSLKAEEESECSSTEEESQSSEREQAGAGEKALQEEDSVEVAQHEIEEFAGAASELEEGEQSRKAPSEPTPEFVFCRIKGLPAYIMNTPPSILRRQWCAMTGIKKWDMGFIMPMSKTNIQLAVPVEQASMLLNISAKYIGMGVHNVMLKKHVDPLMFKNISKEEILGMLKTHAQQLACRTEMKYTRLYRLGSHILQCKTLSEFYEGMPKKKKRVQKGN